MGERTIPTLAQARNKFSTSRPGQLEGIRQSLYDFLPYPAAGATEFRFFQLPQGQGATSAEGATGSKTLADTNMESAGQLPNPKSFLITSIELIWVPGSSTSVFSSAPWADFNATAADAALAAFNDGPKILNAGYLEFFVGSKIQLQEGPLNRFPAKAYTATDGSLASNGAATGALMTGRTRSAGRPYYLEPEVLLTPNLNFSVAVKFPVAVATASSNIGRMGIILDGYLYRS